MGLVEFVRQWPRRDLVTGVLVSLLVHALIVLSVLQWRPSAEPYSQRRGDALIVELAEVDEPASAGSPTAPASRPAPRPAAPPAVARQAPTPQTPTPPARPAAPPEPLPSQPPARVPEPAPPAQAAPVPSSTAPTTVPPPPVPPAAPPVLSTPPVVATPAVPPPPAGEARDGRAGTDDAGAAPAGPRVAAVPPSTGPEAPDLRSALRRGAGGSGEGRGGVEGEPIPLDSADPKYNDYLEQVRRKIKANWGFPCLPVGGNRRCEYKTTQLVVEFGIAKDGRVPFVVVRNSSGYPIYDDYAVNAIKFSSPFPPVPDSVSRTGFPINATFRYVVESSLTNLLR